jgi:hypothetical protein
MMIVRKRYRTPNSHAGRDASKEGAFKKQEEAQGV